MVKRSLKIADIKRGLVKGLRYDPRAFREDPNSRMKRNLMIEDRKRGIAKNLRDEVRAFREDPNRVKSLRKKIGAKSREDLILQALLFLESVVEKSEAQKGEKGVKGEKQSERIYILVDKKSNTYKEVMLFSFWE